MNRRGIEKITIPDHNGRWINRPDADGECCEKHRRMKRGDDRKRAIAEARRAKWKIGL
jgi:hypothetical protein